ncbi:MAG: hypothetical protein WC299_15995 [Kiritimatiellia bacterium]
MNKLMILAALLAALGQEAGADYISGRKAAAALAQSGKHQEALIAYSNLFAEAITPAIKVMTFKRLLHRRLWDDQRNA